MQEEDPYEASAHWLREVSQRRAPGRPASVQAFAPSSPRTPERAARSHARGLVLSCALSLAFLQYYFLDVMVQIETLPEIVIFVNAPASA